MQNYKFTLLANHGLIAKYVNFLIKNQSSWNYTGHAKMGNDALYLELCIPYGETKIIYNSYEFIFNLTISDKLYPSNSKPMNHQQMFLTIICESSENAQKLFKDFLLDVEEYGKEKRDNEIITRIYKGGSGWTILSYLPKRPINTICLNKKDKNAFIDDLTKFYNSQEDYKKFNINYKRVYLLSGAIGTGKSSLIFSVASMFNKRISIINFGNSLDDTNMVSAINHLDTDTILVFENVDDLYRNSDEKTKFNSSNVSFNCFMNTLDGFYGKENLVIFITAHSLKNINKMLIRPGRVDYILSLDYNRTEQLEQIQEMFEQYFPNQIDKFAKFKEMIGKIGYKKISMALLQKFLFDNRTSENILGDIEKLEEMVTIYEENNHTMYS